MNKKIVFSLLCILTATSIPIKSMMKEKSPNVITTIKIRNFGAKPSISWITENIFAINNPSIEIYKIKNGKTKICDTSVFYPDKLFNAKNGFLAFYQKHIGTKIIKIDKKTGKIEMEKNKEKIFPIGGHQLPSYLTPQHFAWKPMPWKNMAFVMTSYPIICTFSPLPNPPLKQHFICSIKKNFLDMSISTIKFSSTGKCLSFLTNVYKFGKPPKTKIVFLNDSLEKINEFSLNKLQDILAPIPKKDNFLILQYDEENNKSIISSIDQNGNPKKIANIKGKINDMDISPKGDFIAIAMKNKIHFLDAKSGKKIKKEYDLVSTQKPAKYLTIPGKKVKITPKETIIHKVKFNKNGKYIASVEDEKIQIWKNPLHEITPLRKKDLLERIQYILEIE